MSEVIQQDSDTQIMEQASGMPYLAIFNSNGEPIKDPRNDLPVGVYVVNFEFIEDDENIDEAIIELETDNPDLISIPDFNVHMILRIQWGIIFADGNSNIGPVKLVKINDHSIEGTAEGVRITLKCTCPSIQTKFEQASTGTMDLVGNNNDFITWLRHIFKGHISIKVIDYEKPFNVQRAIAKRDIEDETIQTHR